MESKSKEVGCGVHWHHMAPLKSRAHSLSLAGYWRWIASVTSLSHMQSCFKVAWMVALLPSLFHETTIERSPGGLWEREASRELQSAQWEIKERGREGIRTKIKFLLSRKLGGFCLGSLGLLVCKEAGTGLKGLHVASKSPGRQEGKEFSGQTLRGWIDSPGKHVTHRKPVRKSRAENHQLPLLVFCLMGTRWFCKLALLQC